MTTKRMNEKYQTWLEYAFNRKVKYPAWYFDLDANEFDCTDEEVVYLIIRTFEDSGADLERFTDAQVNQGIDFLVNPSCSNYMFSVRDLNIPVEKKKEAYRSIATLYKDCFANRCTDTLSFNDEEGGDLNSICYMFWDVCPLNYLKQNKDKKELEGVLFEVLEQNLQIKHRACREGTLHGLGHLVFDYPERIREIIENFVKENELDPWLKEYAISASSGCIL